MLVQGHRQPCLAPLSQSAIVKAPQRADAWCCVALEPDVAASAPRILVDTESVPEQTAWRAKARALRSALWAAPGITSIYTASGGQQIRQISMWSATRASLLLAALFWGAASECTPQTYPKTGPLPQVQRARQLQRQRSVLCLLQSAWLTSIHALQAVNFSETIRELQWLGFDKDADQVCHC